MVEFTFRNMSKEEIADDLLSVIQKIAPHVSSGISSEYANTPLLSMSIGFDYIHMVYLMLALQDRYKVDISKLDFDSEESYTFGRILDFVAASISKASD